jgi:hypothetical protein
MIRSRFMDEAQIKKMVSEYLSQTLNESLECRLEAPPLSQEERAELLNTHEVLLDEAAQDLAEGRHRKPETLFVPPEWLKVPVLE